MKLILMWAAAVAWFLFCAYFLSFSYFREALSSDRGFFERPEKLLTGIGGLTLAGLAPVAAALVHRYHRRRLRGRLIKEKEKIERRLRRLDEKEAAAAPRRAPVVEVASAPERG